MHNFYILSPAKLFFNAKPSFHHGLKKYPHQEDTTSMVVMAVVMVMATGLLFFRLAGSFLARLPILLQFNGDMGDAVLPAFPAYGIL